MFVTIKSLAQEQLNISKTKLGIFWFIFNDLTTLQATGVLVDQHENKNV